MFATVALHHDSLNSEKKFLICIARRPSLNDPKDKPSLLGFDQFSSRIDLNYDIENLDSRFHFRKQKEHLISPTCFFLVIWNVKHSIRIFTERISEFMYIVKIFHRLNDIFKKVFFIERNNNNNNDLLISFSHRKRWSQKQCLSILFTRWRARIYQYSK